jgi:cell division topological specificity factor
VLDFFKTLFRPVPPSGTTAKERLRLVLLSDHLSLAPDVIESLKRDLLDVISRYVEIDPAHADVTFEQRESEVAMLASIPITGVRARERPAPPTPAPVAAPPAATAAPAPTQEAPELALALTEPAAAPASPGPAQSAQAKAPRRRRRRKKVNSGGAAPASTKLATGSA